MDREKLIKTVISAKAGDNNAISDLYNEFYKDVYAIALRETKNPDIACDVSQEAFIEMINTIANLHEPAAFASWMKAITYHQCTRYYKKKDVKHETVVDETEGTPTVFDSLEEESADFIPDKALEGEDFKATMKNFIDELPDSQRSAIMMKYFEELSVKQIAEIQGVTENTVISRLNYGRKAIRSSIENYEKRHDIRLHAIPLLPLLRWLFNDTTAVIPVETVATVAEGVSAATGTTITASIASSTATATVATATSATTTAAGTATAMGLFAKLAGAPLLAKAASLVVVVSLAVGVPAAILSDDDVSTDASSVSSDEISDTFETYETVEDTETYTEAVDSESKLEETTEETITSDTSEPETETEETFLPDTEPIDPDADSWYRQHVIEFSNRGNYSFTTTYHDKKNVLGEFEVSAIVSAVEITEGCEDGYKRILAYALLDVSDMPEEYSFTFSFSPFDKHSGYYFDLKESEIESTVPGQGTTTTASAIVESKDETYNIDCIIYAYNDFPTYNAMIIIECPAEYDGTAFQLGYDTIEDESQQEGLPLHECADFESDNVYFGCTAEEYPEEVDCEHTWWSGDCSEPKVCSTCGAIEVGTSEHKWKDATCEAPQTCIVCYIIQGKVLGHDLPEYDCGDCDSMQVQFKGLRLSCDRCHQEVEVPLLDHTYTAKTPTCTTSNYCTVCKTSKYDRTPHKWKNEICSECGDDIWNYILCDEKTVNNPVTGEEMTVVELLELTGDIDKVGSFDSTQNRSAFVDSIDIGANGTGLRYIIIAYSDGTSSAVVECDYCGEFPCPDGGDENCSHYDVAKDSRVTCQQCGRPYGDGYNGTCYSTIDWANGGITTCHHYD